MAYFKKQADGSIDDRARIILGENEVHIFKRYEIEKRFLEVPNRFSFVIGSSRISRELSELHPAGSFFKIKIGPEVVQFSGRTDGYAPEGSSGATELMIRGRDSLAHLVDGHIENDRSFTSATFEALARACIEGAGIKGYSLVFDRSATRKAVTGIPITKDVEIDGFKVEQVGRAGVQNNQAEIANLNARLQGIPIPHPELEYPQFAAVTAIVDMSKVTVKRITGYRSDNPIKFDAGSTWFAAGKKNFDRGGLHFHAGVDPEGGDEFVFVLSEPNATQHALYALFRVRENPDILAYTAVNILKHQFKNETQARWSHYVVLGKANAGKDGRHKIRGEFIDQEMVGLGIIKKNVVKADEAKNKGQADYLARRSCALARRQSWTLVYTIKGHTAPVLGRPDDRAVWDIDTVVNVHDEELGIYGNFWIEGVNFSGGADGTYTTLTLMRPEDLVFGEGEFYAGPKAKKKKGKKGSKAAAGAATSETLDTTDQTFPDSPYVYSEPKSK
jgi:prophage tail gpP-like protein